MNLGYIKEKEYKANIAAEEDNKRIALNLVASDIVKVFTGTNTIQEVLIKEVLEAYNKERIKEAEVAFLYIIYIYQAYKKGLNNKKDIKEYIYKKFGLKEYIELVEASLEAEANNKYNSLINHFNKKEEPAAAAADELKTVEEALADIERRRS